MESGVAIAVGGRNGPEWTNLLWADHWAWRSVASAAATFGGATIAGAIARRYGIIAGILSALPSELYWIAIAVVGWTRWQPFDSTDVVAISVGYKIASTVLALATIPIASAGGDLGGGLGRANAQHYDSRRLALLGVPIYHLLWLPILFHLFVLEATWGVIYCFQWVAAQWKSGPSCSGVVPLIFALVLWQALRFMGNGAHQTYLALGGFDVDDPRPAWRRVLYYGFACVVIVGVILVAVSLAHYGLGRLGESLQATR
jgi:hypothetical protein